jgi:hypothetical protein
VYVSKGKIDNIYADEDKDAVCFLEVNKWKNYLINTMQNQTRI